MSRIARTAALAAFRRIEAGRLELRETWSGGRFVFGRTGTGPGGTIEVHDPRFYGRLMHGGIGLGNSYADGLWDSADLFDVLRLAARELRRLDGARRLLRHAGRPIRRLRSDVLRNTPSGARSNIAAHYDLGNELFETFLDRQAMLYSSALYEREDYSLEAAQRAKLDRICRALELTPATHLLEIGGGWGGLAIHAASNYGCRVTTTTISAEQRSYAQQRVRRAGLEHRVQVIGRDYRELRGRFDRLVSIEMIEAVGWQYFDLFFRRCSELLAPDGLMFLQAIATDDRLYETEKDAATFSNRLIFPGGCLPSVETIARCLARQTDMRTVWLEDISPSYVLTLRAWRQRFLAAEQQLTELGYDRRFQRLWDIYFAISAAGFAEARIMDVQMLCAKPAWRGRVAGATQATCSEGPAEHLLERE